MTHLEVRAGHTGLRVILGNLRQRWWVLALIPVPFVFGTLVSGNGLKGFLPGALLVGLVLLGLGIVLGCLWFYSRSTITVTETELRVNRLRHRRLARTEVGEALVGLFGSRPQLASMIEQAVNVVITDRAGGDGLLADRRDRRRTGRTRPHRTVRHRGRGDPVDPVRLPTALPDRPDRSSSGTRGRHRRRSDRRASPG